MFKSIEQLEKDKSRISYQYEKAMRELYNKELHEVFKWFVKKFPKRHLRWISGMGSSFFVLDGEILHWESCEQYYDGNWDIRYRDSTPDRVAKVLMPLWNVFQSIHDVTNCVNGDWIQTEEFNSNDYHFDKKLLDM